MYITICNPVYCISNIHLIKYKLNNNCNVIVFFSKLIIYDYIENTNYHFDSIFNH